MPALFHMNCFQNISYSFIPRFLIYYVFKHCLVVKIFMGGHILIASELLGKITDQSLELLPFPAGVKTVDPNLSVALLQYSADDPHECCLSSTVWSQQSEHPVPNIKRNTAKGFER